MSDEVPRSIDAVVVGAGQAGLIMSWHLQRAGRDHVVLDRRETLGGGWQDRWDDFVLVGPNWTTGLPGYAYDGPEPDAFMGRDAVAARIRGYAAAIAAALRRFLARDANSRVDLAPDARLVARPAWSHPNRVWCAGI